MRTVRPSPQWQDSLIRIEKGQRVVIDTEETWSPDMRNQIAWCGADGVYNLPAGEGYLMPGANVGTLVARIGDGPVFAPGSRYDFVSDWEGVLHLAMNENPSFNNQAGKVVAQVIIFEAQ
ncbi:uncharacterized protein METZ01_LOCUS296897 [marine metagenome]|jgi:hypothetical protein|uniref:Uncharacterized protein n=1 Tax=marine metagenome TaxID=408172 RepID=A0A382M547_9ZZZZ